MNRCDKCNNIVDGFYLVIRGYLYCTSCAMYIPETIKTEIVNKCKNQIANTDVSRIRNILYIDQNFNQSDVSDDVLKSLK